jgi:hypothetical protein
MFWSIVQCLKIRQKARSKLELCTVSPLKALPLAVPPLALHLSTLRIALPSFTLLTDFANQNALDSYVFWFAAGSRVRPHLATSLCMTVR